MCIVTELVEDPLIKTHLGKLYEQLLESNLIKIIQPFSCVEIEHVAKLIKLPLPQIELKYVCVKSTKKMGFDCSTFSKNADMCVCQMASFRLSQMILDHKFHGILDQGKGQLIVYESALEDVRAVFYILSSTLYF